jgi:hypothetical protein
MTIFLILAPYAAFAMLMLVTSAALSLFVAAGICMAVIVHDALAGRSIKMLPAGSATLFAGLGTYLGLVDSSWSGTEVKLAVDLGMLAISLGSMLIRRPFTLQYAIEAVDAQTARLPGFVRANYVITWAWSLAFVLMATANLLLMYLPGLPLWSGIAIAFAARYSALYFTKWYPEYRRSNLPAPTARV